MSSSWIDQNPPVILDFFLKYLIIRRKEDVATFSSFLLPSQHSLCSYPGVTDHDQRGGGLWWVQDQDQPHFIGPGLVNWVFILPSQCAAFCIQGHALEVKEKKNYFNFRQLEEKHGEVQITLCLLIHCHCFLNLMEKTGDMSALVLGTWL